MNYQAQAGSSPAQGGYLQPSAGVTFSGVGQYRDAFITVEAAAATTGPAAAAVLATITPGTAGLWEVVVTASVTGVSVIAAESNNIGLYQTAAAKLNPIPMPASTAGVTPPVKTDPIILSLSATDTVNVKAIANATATAVYAVSIVARQVG